MAWITLGTLTALGDASAAALVNSPSSKTRAAISANFAPIVAAQLALDGTIRQAATDAMADAAVRAQLAWGSKAVTSGQTIDTLIGSANVGLYRIDSTNVTGTPVPKLGTLEVQYNSSAGRTIQIFTDADPNNLSQSARVHAAGQWTTWTSFGWSRGFMTAGTDFDSIRTPGSHPVQFANHPNQPVASIGALEVLRASGEYIQRFTTRESDPRMYVRATVGSTWHPWKGPFTVGSVVSFEGRLTQVEAAAAVGTARSALAPATGTPTSRPAAEIMTTMSSDRTHGWNAYTSVLSETWDDGATWTPVPLSGPNPFAGSTIESVLELDNGDLMVSCFRGSTSRRELWVSSGYPSGPATFTKTKDSRARGIKFTSAWSQSTHGRLVLVNEYGPKTGALWDGEEVLPGENARYTFLSMDYGRTWRTVFDLNTFLTGQVGRASTDTQHLHGVAWDPWWDRIWVSYGDNSGGNGSNGVCFSDDLGVTWHSAHHYSGPTAPNQVVGIVPLPRCVLFGGDNGSPDVLRIDRSEGKKAGTYPMPVAFDSTAAGKHLCQSIHRANRVGDDAPTFMAFSAEGEASPSFVAATFDGYTFAEVWRDSINQAAGFGARNIVGPTVRGQVILASNDQRVPGSFSEVRMKAPGY